MTTPQPSTASTVPGYLPDVTGLSNRAAASVYAAAGVCLVPVKPGTKNPGSYLGQGWPSRATSESGTVDEWWRRWPKAGIAMHPGPSGFLVVDVDEPEHVPASLFPLLNDTLFRPTTVDRSSGRGHYFFRLKPGQRFGSGRGSLRPAKGEAWGEIRCYGGAIVLGPSLHPRAADGGGYACGPAGIAAELPDAIAEKLNAADPNEVPRPITSEQLERAARTFLCRYHDERDPSALAPILNNFDPTRGSRHGSMFDTLCWAMREAKAGCFPAAVAAEQLKAAWETAIGGTPRNGDRDEWDRMLRDAIDRADGDGTVEELWSRAHRNQWPSPNLPLLVAREVEKRAIANQQPIALWADQWFRWDGPQWRKLQVTELRQSLYMQLEHATYDKSGDRLPWNPDKIKIDKLVDALKAVVALPDNVTAPSWTNDVDERVLACQNGLLRVEDRTLLPHSPNYFNVFSLPFDYDPDAVLPRRWLRFIDEVFGGEEDAVAAIQEWFGYVISGRTDLQKMLMLIGPPRSGKGTIDRVLAQLVGADSHVGLSGRDLDGDFGLAVLLGKSVAVFSDERMPLNAKRFVETLLRITGEDAVTIAQKYKAAWTGRLGTRFMFMSNELPTLPDNSGAIIGRLILLHMPKSFIGREDPGLAAALLEELPAILNWSLDGLERLQRQGAFTSVAGNTDLVQLLREGASPVKQFVAERCQLKRGGSVAKDELYRAWTSWCTDMGHQPGDRSAFTKKLFAAFGRDVITGGRSGPRNGQVWVYRNIALRRYAPRRANTFSQGPLRVARQRNTVDDE